MGSLFGFLASIIGFLTLGAADIFTLPFRILAGNATYDFLNGLS